MTKPYRVLVVVDREYGQRLTALTQEGPVWVVDTPANSAVAQQIWDAEPKRSHLQGITISKFPKMAHPQEDILVNEFDTIDLHHGPFSANPPYTELDVIGTAITPRVRTELGQFGFDDFQETPHGFRAVRPIPKDDATASDGNGADLAP